MPTGWPHYRDIAIRWAFTDDQPKESYFVAMRRTSEGVEEVDSRQCDFRESVFALRNLVPPVLFIPGVDPTNPISHPPEPGPFHGSTYTVINFKARQPGGQPITVELSATSGHLAVAVADIFHDTEPCWPSGRGSGEECTD